MRGRWALAACAATLIACQDPTQITVQIRTDLSCDEVAGTTITVGDLPTLDTEPPATTTAACTPVGDEGDIGSIVLVPADRDDLAVGMRVALARGGDLSVCQNVTSAPDCVIARRSMRYLERTKLTVPIDLNRACFGVPCEATETCVEGVCVDARTDPNDCISPDGCEPTTASVGGGGGAGGTGGAGGVGGAGGGGECAGVVDDDAKLVLPVTGGPAPSQIVITEVESACTFAVAWRTTDEICLVPRTVLSGMSSATVVCEEQVDVADIALTATADGEIVVAAWSSGPPTLTQLWLWEPGAPDELVVAANPAGIIGGVGLVGRGEEVILAGNVEGALRLFRYEVQSSDVSTMTEWSVNDAPFAADPVLAWGAGGTDPLAVAYGEPDDPPPLPRLLR